MRSLCKLSLVALLASCSASEDIPRPVDLPGVDGTAGGKRDAGALPNEGPDIQRSTRSSLQWKRYATFENDLASALALAPTELCNEFGVEPCIRGVHLGPLGGHDIKTGLLESPLEPLVTTPTVVQRVVLSACLARVAKERESPAGVFADVGLDGEAPEPGSRAADALVTSLVRRFLARDPSDDELDILGALARDAGGSPRSASDFATAVCLALGTSTEFLFF